MEVQTPAQITGSHLSRTSVNRATGLKVKADGDPIGTIKVWPSSQTPDTKEWLECDGSTFDTTKYPELYAALGSGKLPDYKGQFLRGGNAADAGKKFEDTIKTHDVVVPSHTHTFTLNATGTVQTATQSGTVKVVKDIDSSSSSSGVLFSSGFPIKCCRNKGAQKTIGTCSLGEIALACKYSGSNFYYDGKSVVYLNTIDSNGRCLDSNMGVYCSDNNNVLYANNGVDGAYALINLKDINSTSSSISPSYINIPTVSSLNKTIENGTVSGLIDQSGDLIGTYNGSSETAPRHTIIRYFIKAL